MSTTIALEKFDNTQQVSGSATPGQAGPTPERIMQTASGFWAAKALLTAVELGVFTELAEGPLQMEVLRERLQLHERSAQDFFDALVAMCFLEKGAEGYRNSVDADLFLDRNKPSYIGGVLEMANGRLYGFWGHLTEALKTGEQQNEGKGGCADSLFATLYADSGRLKGFLSAMSGLSRGANQAIARMIPWHRYETFVDVGTAQGDLAVQIAQANPFLRGVGFDLAAVQPVFEEYVQVSGVSDRVRFEAGDFFHEELPQADVITMGHILHDWNLAQKKMLIAKAYRALKPGGLLVVYDAIIDDERSQNLFGLLMSLNMLIETPGGFDYTGAECVRWMEEAGFRGVQVHHLVGPDSMVVGRKG